MRHLRNLLFAGAALSFATAAALLAPTLWAQDAPPAGASEATDVASTSPVREPFRLVGAVPLEGELLSDRVVLFFNKDIQLDGELRQVVDISGEGGAYARGNHVVYLTTEADRQGVVTMHFSDGFRSVDGDALSPDDRDLVFTAVALEPLRAFLHREIGSTTQIGLAFSVPVSASALREHLSVRAPDGSPVPHQLNAGPDERIHLVTLTDYAAWPVVIEVSGGLVDRSGQLTLAESRIFSYPSDTVLRVEKVAWGETYPYAQGITLEFDRPVDPDSLRESLSLTLCDPEMSDEAATAAEAKGAPLEYDIWEQNEDSGRVVVGVNIETGGALVIRVELAAGLRAREHATLTEPFVTALRRTPAPFRVRDYWWNQPYKEGLALYLTCTSAAEASDVQAALSVVPEVPNLRVEPQGASRFYIYGDWNSRTNYELTIKQGMPYAGGQQLSEDVTLALTTPEVPSYLGFGYAGKFYFPRKAGLPLALHARNVDEAQLTLYRLFPSNLPVALGDMEDDAGNWRFNDAWCEQLAQTSLNVRSKPDRVGETPLDLSSLFLTNQRGVFCLEARDTKRSGSEARKLIVWTDLGVLAHWQERECSVFVHDLISMAPLPFADVRVYSDKNQLLGQGATDAEGMLRLANFNPSYGEPRVVVAELGDDFTFLELEHRSEDPVAYTPDMPKYDRDGYDAFIYADRDIYRPGETAHLRWMVRTNYGDALGAVPLRLRVLKPNGRALFEKPTQLSDLGTGGIDLETERAYPTGRYAVDLLVPGEKTPIGSYAFHLEDFVPNRIKADVDAPEGVLSAGATHEVRVHAEHLFGAPAADRKAALGAVLRRKPFTSERWAGYRFDNDSEFTSDVQEFGEVMTDAQGDAVFTVALSAPPEATMPLNAVWVARVFELGGRAVSATKETTLFPSDIALGAAAFPQTGGTGLEVNVAAIKPDETPADLASVQVTLERQTWNYYVRRYYSHHEANWSESFQAVETREVALNEGRGTVSFQPSGWGYYRVRVHSEATPQFSTVAFYSYDGRCEIVDAARPSLIKVLLDKDAYAPGDRAIVRVESPFDGKGVVVVQGDTIRSMHAVDIRDGVGTVELEVTRSHFPNVWVEATVIHSIESGKTPVHPFSSFAMTALSVSDVERRVAVSLHAPDGDLPEEIRPARQTTFVVETRTAAGDPISAEVTLAAVDEGIHLVRGYANPDPYAWLSRPRRPDLRRAHYYDKIAYDFDKPRIGGGLDALIGKRTVSPDDNWIKPLALWSGVVRTDAQGRATVTFDVPEFSGQLRLVAVAATDRALGAAAEEIYVRRPYVLRTGMPRFLLPGDRAQTRATVFNHTDAPVKAVVSWSASGAIGGGGGEQTLEAPPHGEASLTAEITAGVVPGQGAIRWETRILDAQGAELDRMVEDAALPVAAPAAYQSTHETIVLQPGETRTLRNTAFIDDARTELDVLVAAHPALRLAKSLAYVIGYPHGCAEQTVSRLFPMYLLRKNADLLQKMAAIGDPGAIALKPEELGDIGMYLGAGINKLFAMQTSSGGLASWSGSDEPYPYGSVYAFHFLSLVHQGREFPLPEANYEALRNYVRGLTADWTDASPSSLYLRAYALYALALDGDLEAIEQIHRFDAVSLPRAARYMLAAALAANTQDEGRVSMYLSAMPSHPHTVTEPDGTLNSDIRNTAVELLALRQAGGDPTELSARAAKLLAWLDQTPHGTTQQMAFVIAALSGYLDDLSEGRETASASVSYAGATETVQADDLHRVRHEGPGGEITVANTGGAPIYISFTTRGVPASPNLDPVAEGVAVARRYYTAAGEPLEGDAADAFSQTTAYVVGITLECMQPVRNLVVVDLLPAGFEIENPRLDEAAAPGEAFTGAVAPTHLDLRDDRLVLAFDALDRGEHTFYYVVRAVTPGAYQHPPIEAECMYDASVRGASAPGTITVR